MSKSPGLKALLLSTGSIIVFVLLLMLLSQIKNIVPVRFERYTYGILGIFAAFTAVWLFIKIERSTFKEFELQWHKDTIRKFAIGLAIGIFLSLIMIFSQVLYSGLEVKLSSDQDLISFLIWSPAIIILAFMEEVAFRSYPFIRLNREFGFRTTQIIIAILFALYHVINGWPILISFLGPGIWSLAYGLAAKISNGVSMPTGLHSGVNLILALFVGKKNIESLFTIDFAGEVSDSLIKANEAFGIGIQLALLVGCIIATELYLRYRNLKEIKVNKI